MFALDATGHLNERYTETVPTELPSLVLAYVGDAYFHLFVRTRLLSFEKNKVRILNDFSAKIVSAPAQARAYQYLAPQLSLEEGKIYHRAFRAKSHPPRTSTVTIAEYHSSTGFEAILGYLYLRKEFRRLEELCEQSFQFIVKDLFQPRPTKNNKK